MQTTASRPDSASAELSSLDPRLGTVDDNLPFRPRGQKLASIAWRTWIYTDTGPQRMRLGYLRAGAVVDARGPLLRNAGCDGGWLRINPRGFVCLGKGATVDLSHPIVRQYRFPPVRGEGFPYQYAKSRDRPPDRYFRLPSTKEMVEVEGQTALDRAAQFLIDATRSGWDQRLGLEAGPPEFLATRRPLEKPYGVDRQLRRQVTAGRFSVDSGFALLTSFLWEERAFALTSEMDLVPLDRVHLLSESQLAGLVLSEQRTLPVAFVVKGAVALWTRLDSGAFVPHRELRQAGLYLTGSAGKGGMLETEGGEWVAGSQVRIVPVRDSFPSVATGRRKWIDISIRDQTLVAYEGRTPVYVALVSAGRGGLGDEGDSNPEGERTVRGTFMIHEKSISSRMDGEDDRADSFELQDVPWVQYFHRGFALHGAYWHNAFGQKRSHGCINLSAKDSAWLFDWTDPPVPPGWHAVLNKKRGTVVHIRY